MSDAEKKVTKLMLWFAEHPEVPSISPSMGMHLVRISDALTKHTLTEDDLEIREELTKYKLALREVQVISAIHQGAVIGALKAALKEEKGNEAETKEG